MLIHQQAKTNYEYKCRMHGSECPNDLVKQPTNSKRLKLKRDLTDQELIDAAKSECTIESLFATICLLRRDYDYYDRFLKQLHDDFWYLVARSSERVLMSILDTLCDHRARISQAAIIAMSILREWQITCSVYREIDKYEFSWIWPTTMTIFPEIPDTVLNHYRRVAKGLRCDPLVWIMFYEVYKRIVKTKHVPLKPLAKFLDGPSKLNLLGEVTNILRPTTILPKYERLYSLLHKQNSSYGSAPRVAAFAEKFLVQWDAKRVLDFGCGKGKAYRPGLISYDPAWHPEIPVGVFDALISTDVMEHIPDYHLPAICRWFKLWSKRLILGISTRPAKQILENGENAHCTVKPAEWWRDRLANLLRYKVEIIYKTPTYAALKCEQ